MIDEAVLENLLTETADSVTVPGDGPARVLDERDRLVLGESNVVHRFTRRRLAMVAAAAAVVIVVGVVVATDHGSNKNPTHGPAAIASPAPTGVGNGSSAGAGAEPSGSPSGSPGLGGGASAFAGGTSNSSVEGSGSGGTSGGTSPSEVPTVQTKVIKTASVSLQVPQKGLPATMNRLNTIASGQGGYIQTSGTNSAAAGQPANGSATLRVPVANFSAALNQVEGLGNPTSVTTSGQDVTSQYVDLQARLQSLQDARTQFQQILTQAQSIPDILAVEQQISDLQTQIEQLQGQLNVMDDQTSYSTISVTVSEAGAKPAVVAPAHPSGVAKAWAHARRSFAHGFEAVLAASGGIAVFIIFVLAALVLGRLAWAQTRRRLL